MNCRFCSTPISNTFVDLGMSPLANSYLTKEQLDKKESYYPLKVVVCDKCLLVQLPAFETSEHIFEDYDYFSSFSSTMLKHSQKYVDTISKRLKLTESSFAVEVASNDGYLLQYFNKKGIPNVGIEPAKNVAKVANEKGVNTESFFLGEKSAKAFIKRHNKADIVAANNVIAHVPDLNDFVKGLKILLATNGVLTVEFPHLYNLIQYTQFDTIYHEHFSYFSLTSLSNIFKQHGLRIFDIDQLEIHGGSLRIYACLEKAKHKTQKFNVQKVLDLESSVKMDTIEGYKTFGEKVIQVKSDMLKFLIKARKNNKKVVGYGAAAKATTLLQYLGVGHEFIEYVVDRSPHKQGKFLPGSRIPILPAEHIKKTKPDYLLIFPWNIKSEIIKQNPIGTWGAKYVLAIPELKVVNAV